MIEKQLPKEKLKESIINKIYNILGLIQYIPLGILGLYTISLYINERILTNKNGYIIPNHFAYQVSRISNIRDWILATTQSISLLLIVIGIALYVLYRLKRIDKNKKTYIKKFIKRGIIGMILNIIISTITNPIIVDY